MHANALTVIHKYIRRELFEVSARLACAGPADLDALRDGLDKVMELLHQHAAHEEAQFEPLLRERDAGGADRLMRDHHLLHADAENVRNGLAALNAEMPDLAGRLLQLYLDWNRFVGGYLLHIDDEERTLFAGMTQMPELDAFGRMVLAHGEAEGRAFLQELWSIVAPAEREGIERGLSG